MDEEEWLATSNPTAMLEDVALSRERKFRLFAVACCRRVWEHLPGPGCRAAVEVAERYADGGITAEQLDAACERAEPFASPRYGAVHIAHRVAGRHADATGTVLDAATVYADSAVPNAVDAADIAKWEEADAAAATVQAGLLRDLFGNPFRPTAFDPVWRTEAVVALATGMYESRDFSPMPALADALEDAGCADVGVLAHCRGDGPHIRGCWVVDLILGRE